MREGSVNAQQLKIKCWVIGVMLGNLNRSAKSSFIPLLQISACSFVKLMLFCLARSSHDITCFTLHNIHLADTFSQSCSREVQSASVGTRARCYLNLLV